MFGTAEITDYDRDSRRDLSVIGQVERSGAGNIILRVGRCRWPYTEGWMQTEHVVLTPEEADLLVADIQSLHKQGSDR